MRDPPPPPPARRWRRACRAMVRDLKQHLRRLRDQSDHNDDPSQQAVLVAGARAQAAVVRALCRASKYHDGHTCACARIAFGSGGPRAALTCLPAGARAPPAARGPGGGARPTPGTSSTTCRSS